MSYSPNTWNTGDIITAEKLNNMERGIGESETSSNINQILSNIGDAILNAMKGIAYIDENGENYYNAVAEAFGKEAYSAGSGDEGIE